MFITLLLPLLAEGWSRGQRRHIVMGKSLALPPRIRKVLGSYLDPVTGYPDKYVVFSHSSFTQKPGYYIYSNVL